MSPAGERRGAKRGGARALVTLVLIAALLAVGSSVGDSWPTVAQHTATPEPAPVGAAAPASPATPASTTTTTTTTSVLVVPARTASSSAPPTTTAPPPPPPLRIAVAGDTSFTHGLHERHPLGSVADQLADAHLTFVNLETVVAEAAVGVPAAKTFVFKSPPSSLGLLRAAGVDGVSLANNHSLDYGRAGLDRTLELLDQAGLARVGAAAGDGGAAYRPQVLEPGGRSVAVLGFSRVPCDWSAADPGSRPGVAWACEPFVAQTVAAIEQAATAGPVVVLVHWGIEGHACPQPWQRQLARTWVAAGADLIAGSHPHVLQGVEQIDGAWVLYSTGNFAFPSARGASADTALFRFTLTGGDTGLEAVPMRAPGGVVRPAGEREASAILGMLSRRSFGVEFGPEGWARPVSEPGECGP